MIHREGKGTLSLIFTVSLLIAIAAYWANIPAIGKWMGWSISFALPVFILQFFRNPKRNTQVNPKHIIAPADGKIVVIEEVEENEFLNDTVKQISIFMSPFNVHVNRYPVSGKVLYSKHHHGKYLIASHPKSSTKNERTTVVVRTDKQVDILFRQIAGFVARRIVNYAKIDDQAKQGKEFGFIKFGSRMDVMIPKNAVVHVSLNQQVKGGETVIAKFE